MKTILTLTVSLLLLSGSGFSQDWQKNYDKFISEFQAQDYSTAIQTADLLLKEPVLHDTVKVFVLRYQAFSFYAIEDYEKAVETFKTTSVLAEKIYGKEDYNYLQIIFNLAVNYTYIGKYSEAYPLMEEVINFIIKDQTKNSMDYINTGVQQANIYNIAGSYKIAEEIYEDVFRVIKENYKETDTLYMQMVNTIAPFYLSTGNYEKAEPFYVKAPEQVKQMSGELSSDYILTLNSLGEFYQYAGMYDKMEIIFKKSLNLSIEFFGKNTADHATALNNVAVACEKQGKNEEAEKLYLQCIKIKEKVFKKESDFYALSIFNLSVLYDNMGKKSESEALLKEAVDIYSKVYGPDNPNYNIALNSLALTYSNNGKYEKALELFNQVAENQKKLYGEKYNAYAGTLSNIAGVYEQLGRYTEAEQKYEKVCELQKQILGEKHTDYATALSGLAQVKIALGKYPEAETLLLKALEIHKSTVGEKHANYATSLINLAALYSYMGNYQLAGITYEKCRLIYEKLYGDMHPQFSVFLNNYGNYFLESGEYEKAEDELEKSLKIQIASYGEDHPDNVSIITNLANVMLKKGNNKVAEEYLLKSENILKESMGTDHPNYASSLISLGAFYYETGNYDKAEKYYLSAYEKYKLLFGENNLNISTTLNNLGSLYLSKALFSDDINKVNQYASKAEEYLYGALKIDSVILGTNHPDYALHLNNFGEFYRNTGQYDKAEINLLKAIDLEKKIFGENYPDLSVAYHNISMVYSAKAQYDEAEMYCKKALELDQKSFGENNPECSEVLVSLAYILERKGNFAEAEKCYQKALDLNYKAIRENFSFLTEQEKFNFLKTVSHYYDLYCSFAMKTKKTNPSVSVYAYNSEMINKGILLKSTGKMKEKILGSKDPVLIEKYNHWVGEKQKLAKLYSLPESSRFESITEIEESINNLEKELVQKSVEIQNEMDIFSSDWQEIKKNLGVGEASIEFSHYGMVENNQFSDNYFAMIIRQDSEFPIIVSLFEAAELEKIIGKTAPNDQQYIFTVYGSERSGNTALYETLWNPMDSALNGINKIFYSPSGLLHKVSFAGITDQKGISILNRFELNSVSSTALIADKKSDLLKQDDLKINIFGGAQFTNEKTENEAWTYLEGTKNEADNINKIFSTNKCLSSEFSGLQASEENIKAMSGENAPGIIHIATHGFFFPSPSEVLAQDGIASNDLNIETTGEEVAFRGSNSRSLIYNFTENNNPLMRSGLALARANDVTNKEKIEGEDGVLTALEVSNMDLGKTKLVVLSACETGLGDIKGSEGVYGLQRAFKMTGAKFLIMSLWQVPDKETEEFMTTFYTKLLKSKDIRKSFNETQNEMRKKYDPYFWAAFVLIE